MLKETLCILVVCLAVVIPEVAGDACKRYTVNGCSIPCKVHLFYKKQFTGACNRHDVCYNCGKARNRNRKTCDRSFLSNMRSTCSWWKATCWSAAYVYYLAVRAGGSKRYKQTSPSWCGESWVSGCMK
ncbi:uncharacterized protein LOC121386167 [Gigantopelta aegis]|uniref:uncharacterized protein LOC121386167 n=1 Tax=Gigantopelta aegis TaxID=1735272 RepID=UPI001B88BF2B|nr:uncharacterized protein LOC121386167 [Gigantopelta aegis]XP_041372900.1 uncharacterized protein LOC121386167 [Gigantopelta aegis]XP_041372901.1 uncharacterized protein LOC121386167 [Gigantopelta aegis]